MVITTALIPERPAPVLIDKEKIESMHPGSAIIDLAAINGGNCELTKCDEIIKHKHITIDGRANIPSTMPEHASQLYARNLFNFSVMTSSLALLRIIDPQYERGIPMVAK